MPPRISGTRVEHVMQDARGDKKPINPSPKHPGFEQVAEGIARRQHVSMDRARAMLAAGTRRAGAAARKANPRLNRVKG